MNFKSLFKTRIGPTFFVLVWQTRILGHFTRKKGTFALHLKLIGPNSHSNTILMEMALKPLFT